MLFFWAIWVPRLGAPPPPVPVAITIQPRSITVPLGGTGTFSVGTNGDVFQWRHNGQPISGATSATLTITNVQSGDTGPYDVVVTGSGYPQPSYGSMTSATVVLTIGQPIQFVVQPRDASVVVGSSTIFHVEVTGDGPFTYQWQTRASYYSPIANVSDGGIYRGANTPTLVLTPITTYNGVWSVFFCIVTDAHGSPVNSASAVGSPTIDRTQALTVTTLAGQAGQAGTVDGTGIAARLNYPEGIAADAAGNLYATTYGAIRKITPAGVVTTLASLGGLGIAADAAGNLYVTGNCIIQKITPTGVATTMAGLAGVSGSADGIGSAARFRSLMGIAVDAAGNLYASDMDDNTIRKVTPAGVVTTFAGQAGQEGSADGTGNAAQFNNPRGIAVDAAGNLFIADWGNMTIRKITNAGVVTTIAGQAGYQGSNADGTGSAAQIAYPKWVAVAANGDLYLTSDGANTIRKLTPAGVVTTLAGQPGYVGHTDGTGSNALFSILQGIVVDTAGDVFVADSSNSTIRKGIPTTLVVRLGSLSARGLAGSGDQTFIAGFATSGSGPKQLLLRGIGPGLTPFGVSGVVADPALTLFNSVGAVLQQNNDWGGTTALTTAFAQVWAFPLSPNSKDAALLASLPGGVYTAHLAAQSGTGVALLEAYDADPGTPTTRLASLSVRDQVGTGDNILIAGFAITGNVSRTVLIRGVGPTLARYGVSGLLANPQLQVFQGNTFLAQNDDWSGDTTLAAIAAQVNTFALDANSKDAALLLTLPPGAYTAQVSGVSNTTGVALVEIYEVP